MLESPDDTICPVLPHVRYSCAAFMFVQSLLTFHGT